MKRLQFLAGGLLLILSVTDGLAQKSFTIKGQLSNFGAGKIIIRVEENGKPATNEADTVICNQDGSFSYSGKQLTNRAYVSFLAYPEGWKQAANAAASKEHFNAFADTGERIQIQGNGKEPGKIIPIGSSAINKQRQTYIQSKNQLQEKEKNLYTAYYETYTNGDTIKRAALEKEIAQLKQQKDEGEGAYYRHHAGEEYTAYLMTHRFFESNLQQVEQWYSLLRPFAKSSYYGKAIGDKICNLKTSAPGQPAPLFGKPDKDGNMMSLANYKGKYVALDFWGSWCGPCRHGHPELCRLYAKYKGKNFELIGIACGDTRAAWLKAIETDKIDWVHILNGDKPEQDVAKMYSVEGYPTKVIIDPKGKIVARFVGDDEGFAKKIEELLSQ
jgi:thiol-disulfide isomerase/thioredoxin